MDLTKINDPTVISEMLEHAKPLQIQSNQSKNEAFLQKWLGLKTEHNSKLKELELAFQFVTSRIWDEPDHGKLIVLVGPNGVGKTHFANALRKWIDTVGPSNKRIVKVNHIGYLDCIFWRWSKLLDKLKSGEWYIMDTLNEPCVLILDDVGAAHDPSELGTDKLCQILSDRKDKWTVVTTNIDKNNWEECFERRIYSRFLRNSLIVDLTGVPDFNA